MRAHTSWTVDRASQKVRENSKFSSPDSDHHYNVQRLCFRVEVTQYLILLKRKQSEFSESLPQIPGKIIIHGIFLECFKKFISVVKTLQSLFQLS